jgi:predicted dehydrogenase
MTLDAAVIGCGRMGAFTSPWVRAHAPACWFPLAHAEAITAHPSLKLSALADTNVDNLARAAQQYSVARTYEDPLKLIEEVRPALMGIATRTIGRADIIQAAVAAGTRALHVEKPLCTSSAELAALEKLLARDDVFVTFGAIRRHMQPYIAARNFVLSGALGELLEVQANMGNAPLYWAHPHSVDLLLFANQGAAVQSVSARLSGVEREGNAVASDPCIVSAELLFNNGVIGRITRSPGCDLIFSCSKGAITVEADGAETFIYEARDGGYHRRFAWTAPDASDASPAPGGTLAAMTQLVSCLDGNLSARTANAIVKHDIMAGQRMMFAMVQSDRDGVAVSLDALEDWTIWARSGALYA